MRALGIRSINAVTPTFTLSSGTTYNGSNASAQTSSTVAKQNQTFTISDFSVTVGKQATITVTYAADTYYNARSQTCTVTVNAAVTPKITITSSYIGRTGSLYRWNITVKFDIDVSFYVTITVVNANTSNQPVVESGSWSNNRTLNETLKWISSRPSEIYFLYQRSPEYSGPVIIQQQFNVAHPKQNDLKLMNNIINL